MKVQRQELATGCLLPQEGHRGRDILVAEAVELVGSSTEFDIGNRLNIKGKTVH
jgi:hypothetical protein